jgi:hypothetical protein
MAQGHLNFMCSQSSIWHFSSKILIELEIYSIDYFIYGIRNNRCGIQLGNLFSGLLAVIVFDLASGALNSPLLMY